MILRYTPGPIRIAYQVIGTGPTTLIVTPGWASHLEYDWQLPEIRDSYNGLPRGLSLIRYDKRRTGLSTRTAGPDAYSVEAQTCDLLAVLDAAGLERRP